MCSSVFKLPFRCTFLAFARQNDDDEGDDEPALTIMMIVISGSALPTYQIGGHTFFPKFRFFSKGDFPKLIGMPCSNFRRSVSKIVIHFQYQEKLF